LKIVSLLPAATEIVCALGLRDALVGRSHCCDFPEDVAALPRLTRARVDASLASGALDAEVRRLLREHVPLYAIDEVALAAIAPDVVVTQEACEICAVSHGEVRRALARAGASTNVVSLSPARLEDVLADVRTVADACGVAERGDALAAAIRGRLAAVPQPAAAPRVAVVEWLDPPMLAGHWVPDTIRAAGGEPVGPAPGAPSPYASWNEIRALQPDGVVVAPCGFDLARTISEAAPHGEALARLAPRALLLDGNAYLNRPGPRLVDAAETIAGWLRGDVVDPARGRTLEAARAAAGYA
jgi:iron complex transport system substrate-binding protein